MKWDMLLPPPLLPTAAAGLRRRIGSTPIRETAAETSSSANVAATRAAVQTEVELPEASGPGCDEGRGRFATGFWTGR
jgi:hypothetical protein